MRVVFMGSAELACPALRALSADPDVEIAAVVTQPDRPSGRRLKVSSCVVKDLARELGLPVLTPERVNSEDSLAVLGGIGPDLVVVVAYGQILKSAVLNLPRLGCVNIHASLLPRYRGAAPIQWMIAAGEETGGVTAMFMNERMDAGDIIASRELPIMPTDTAGSLHDRLAVAGAGLLLETVAAIRAGKVVATRQDESQATYAPKISKADGLIDWKRPACEIANRVRGFNPWPCCFCVIRNGPGKEPRLLRVLGARVEQAEGKPGEVLSVSGDGPLIGTGDGAVRLVLVQPGGGKSMSGAAYLRGHALAVGDVIG
jgi:methionyl-tRNA formyltransferase